MLRDSCVDEICETLQYELNLIISPFFLKVYKSYKNTHIHTIRFSL